MVARRASFAVLVVEDDWAVRTSISMYLQDAGCRVLEADSGEDAISLLHNGDGVDVVFTDIRLKGKLNGWDVGEAARAIRQNIAVIYASGQSGEPRRLVDGSVFLEKPYDPDAVMNACHALCAAAR